MILLDTTVIIDRAKCLFDPGEDYAVSILTRAEFELGIQSARDATIRARRVRRLAFLDREFDWLEFDIESTRSYGVPAAGALPPGGSKVRSKDALIAAQAHRHGATLMPANIDDFVCFSHLVPITMPTLR
ncbi:MULTISPECIES: PIN domain-containing protein [Gordonia]|uniref:PIN domain-containing protein n=1 Tax=Gordonia pseudamarae TaxID=2831662 RepID=A0ABX6IML7_9ACTN|nr:MULTISPECIES: PIN domain-containing protein [Gordonia]MBD0024255.1 PIN domain-containing protein [Gordonia sp. (in: high G+C Gram-positive bacteria)]QHN37149.1 PIN domain-containing protein [Gordonia pseudamarae]